MPQFKITQAKDGKHTWKAEGKNPKTGRKMTIRGGQAGTAVGPKARGQKTAQAFDARHDATKNTPKKHINRLRWDGKAQFGSSVYIPGRLFP